MIRFEKFISFLAKKTNIVAALAVVAMMLLTAADVFLRLLRHPIPGTYEMVGFLGAVAASFSLGYTSLEKGHIAVDFLMQKMPEGTRIFFTGLNSIVAAVFFAVVSWQAVVYALSLQRAGEVSLTLQMPTYPFVLGLAVGCAILTLVLLGEFLLSLKGVER